MSSDLGPDCEEILAGRPFYLRAGMSVSTGMSTSEHEHGRERESESEGGQGGGRVCERRTLPQMPVIRRNKSEGKATGPRPELLTLGLALSLIHI